jgi:ketosteroid isomerase-like protein
MELDASITGYHDALGAIVRGDPAPLLRAYSEADDVTLSNPWGPTRRGQDEVAAALEHAGTQFRDGGPQATGHDRAALFRGTDLACLVENERWQAKVSGRDELTPFELRVTTVFRREDRGWTVVHRHADPITVVNPKGVLGRPD